jgi:hypothetical protein
MTPHSPKALCNGIPKFSTYIPTLPNLLPPPSPREKLKAILKEIKSG